MKEQKGSMAYRNITISGLPGCGSTTLLRLLKEKLAPEGWQGFSGGEFMRAYALEKGIFKEQGGLHHSAADYEDEFDRKIDYGMREKLQNENNWIIESWLSGFLAQQVPQVLKILLYCSDEAVRIDRIVNRDNVSVDEAKDHVHKRYEANLAKWSRMYGKEWEEWVVGAGKAKSGEKIDFWKPGLYDLTIDTYATSREETLNKVLAAVRAR
jgi:cytidylate kinase